jgi:hypothetical protein
MGNTIWVKVRRGTEIACNEDDHSIMCSLDRQLDRIAAQLGVTRLSDFFDASEMAMDFADFDDDGDGEPPIPDPQWYDAADGLRTVAALLGHVRANPELFAFSDDDSRSHWRSMLIEELDDCQSILSQAANDGSTFHFAIVM